MLERENGRGRTDDRCIWSLTLVTTTLYPLIPARAIDPVSSADHRLMRDIASERHRDSGSSPPRDQTCFSHAAQNQTTTLMAALDDERLLRQRTARPRLAERGYGLGLLNRKTPTAIYRDSTRSMTSMSLSSQHRQVAPSSSCHV